MLARITSRSNPLVRRTRLLGTEPSARKEEKAFIAEGIRLVEEARAARSTIEQRGWSIRSVSALARCVCSRAVPHATPNRVASHGAAER